IFKTNLCGALENPEKIDSLQYKIIGRHLDTALRNQLLDGNYIQRADTIEFNPSEKESAYSVERLENEFYHCLILWEMILFGYFRTYLSRLNIVLPPSVRTNPFKIVVQVCEKNPRIFADFIEYFASKLEAYSITAKK
ncbi:MAG: hypothetical protein LUQ65_12935, partial [Candidatus Helarchaeota archaeon]|nr:hypothetical protein [Candidatus Helarchaeota archaeon]